MYKYIKNGNTIICLSSYAGKTVRGIAKCAPEDEFDEGIGKTIARGRCNYRVAQLRYQNAIRAYNGAAQDLRIAEEKFLKMRKYERDAREELLRYESLRREGII